MCTQRLLKGSAIITYLLMVDTAEWKAWALVLQALYFLRRGKS